MSLTAGTRLGPYEIVAPLGAGGMGEVYKARDTRLDRSVAIKVLLAPLVSDPEFRERFEREAKSISALNHPNICTVYDVGEGSVLADEVPFGEAQGTPSVSRGVGLTPVTVSFLVMELLEGETLAERLQRSPIPVAEALKIGVEVASALDKAHRFGIVHRDLKPSNVMLTKGGAKLLDFGLAKVGPAGVTSSTPATAMTKMASPLTAQGTILGTFQYMAPEQIEGDEADARTDIFAFGAVLYEMLTGRKAFAGKSNASLMSAILKDEPPPVSTVQPLTPLALDRVVTTCLAKDRDERFQSAHDLLLQLRWLLEGGSGAGAPAPVVVQRRHRERAVWVALGVVAVVWLATLVPAWKYVNARPNHALMRFEIATPPVDVGTGAGVAGSPAISPDGRFIVFVAQTIGEERMLWLRQVDADEARPIDGTEGGMLPFWSADGKEIGFFALAKLWRINVAGGASQVICDATTPIGATWNRSGTIVFASGVIGTNALYRVPATGGTAVVLVQPDQKKQEAFASPSFLPDGRHLLYSTRSAEPSQRAVFVRSIDGGPPTHVVNADSMALYASGHLLYHSNGSLVAHAFDQESFRVSGEPLHLADRISFNSVSGRAAFTVSETGILAFRAGSGSQRTSDLVWVDRKGQAQGTVGEADVVNQVRLSPDERRLAVSRLEPRSGIFHLSTIDLRSQVSSQLTFGDTSENDPAWSPDSQSVAFESLPKGKRDLYMQAVGTRNPVLAYESADDPKWLDDWSPDGRFLLFHVPLTNTLYAAPLSGDKTVIELTRSRGRIDAARFSPDSKWVSYATDESGQYETWVASFPAFNNRQRISSHGGAQARWRADMRELLYLTPAGQMMSVEIVPDATTGTLTFKAPVLLFQSPLTRPELTIDQYDVSRDGKRFIFIRPKLDLGSTTSPLKIVVNWPALIASPKNP